MLITCKLTPKQEAKFRQLEAECIMLTGCVELEIHKLEGQLWGVCSAAVRGRPWPVAVISGTIYGAMTKARTDAIRYAAKLGSK